MRASTKKKLLILLSSGLALGLARTPKNYYKIIKATHQAFQNFDKENLLRLLKEFRKDRLVEFRDLPDGTTKIVITEDGKKKTLRYEIDELKIDKPKHWDKKWRLVVFDIPDKKKNAREALRKKLKDLGFYQFQKSVFVFPYECEDEINFIVEIFEVRKHVRLATVIKITNESELKLHFNVH